MFAADFQVGKSDEMCFPDAVDAASPWASWIMFLLNRYASPSTPSDLRILALEIINEPNLLYWPAVTPNAPCTVAQMIITASAIGSAVNKQCFMTGPGAADSDDHPPAWMYYRDFTTGVANILDQSNWQDPTWVWSHHNYADVLNDQGSKTQAPDRATKDRATMRAHYVVADLDTYSWAGVRTGGVPAVWITEGGCHRPSLLGTWGAGATTLWPAGSSKDHQQAVLLQRNRSRLLGSEGAGVGLHMNYLFTSQPPTDYDSGLCDENGVPRTEPMATWTSFVP